MVVELTEIAKERLKTIKELEQKTGKEGMDKDEQNLGGLKWIPFG